ncbi:IS110 family transposase [Soehngenia saccharolytica]|nr:IS110 family transposase [Soehngenia saccharolytica]
MRRTVVKDLTRTKNQIHNWLDIYFPEYKVAYVNWESKSFITIIKQHSLPSEIVKLSPNQIYEMLSLKMRMGVGIAR